MGTPDFYVSQGLSLDCVPAAIAMAMNRNMNLTGTSKLNASDVKYVSQNYRTFWSVKDATDALEAFRYTWVSIDGSDFNGAGQAIVFTKVGAGIGHAVFVEDGIVYDPLALAGHKVYPYDELEIRDEAIVIN